MDWLLTSLVCLVGGVFCGRWTLRLERHGVPGWHAVAAVSVAWGVLWATAGLLGTWLS